MDNKLTRKVLLLLLCIVVAGMSFNSFAQSKTKKIDRIIDSAERHLQIDKKAVAAKYLDNDEVINYVKTKPAPFRPSKSAILSEGFEGGLPATWTIIDADGDGNNWYVAGTPNLEAHTGDSVITSASWLDVDGGTILTPDNWLITPQINLTGPAKLKFWVANQDDYGEHYSVWLSTTGNAVADFTTELFSETLPDDKVWREKTINITQTGNVYLAFRHHESTDMFMIKIDDIEVSLAPTTPTIETSLASLDFGQIIVGNNRLKTVDITGYALTTVITATAPAHYLVSADNANYAVTATIPQAGGSLYVKYMPGSAGTHNGNLTLSATGATNVDIALTGSAIACEVNNLPFSEGFEGATCPPTQCWTVIYGDGAGTTNPVSNSTSQFHNGAQSFRFSSSSNTSDFNQYLISPELNITRSADLEFWYRRHSTSSSYGVETFRVGYSTTTSDIADFTWLSEVTVNDNPIAWQKFAHTFISENPKYIAINYNSDFSYYLYIDDLLIEETTSCPKPTNLTSTNFATTSAELGWTESGTATAWKIEYTPESGSATVVDASSNPFTLTSLSAGTNYSFRVKAVCSASDESNWSYPKTFTTLCLASTLPLTESFESTQCPALCWSIVYADAAYPSANAMSHFEYASSVEGARVFRFSSYASSSASQYNQYLISPEISSSADLIKISFSYRKSNTSTETFRVGYSTTTNEIDQFTWEPTIADASDTEWKVCNAMVPSNAKFIAINYNVTSSYWRLYIDDLSISEITSVNISGTVTKLSDGTAISGATVAISGAVNSTATTDGSGAYTFSVADGNTYSMTVSAAGYNSVTESVAVSGATTKDFSLTAPVLGVSPASLDVNTTYGVDKTENVTINNTGDGQLSWISAINYTNPVIAQNFMQVLTNFDGSASGQYAVCSDGQNIYTSYWATAGKFAKYTLDGTFVEDFTIAGVGGIRDLTYDGQYFYGGANSSILYKIDLANKALIESTTVTGVSNIRHCTFDPVADAFWVGAWDNLYKIDRTGNILFTSTAAIEDVSGSAYDNVSAGGPYLLFNTQPSSNSVIKRYNIATDAIEAYEYDINANHSESTNISGGAFAGLSNDKYVLYTLTQQDPARIITFELASMGWLKIVPSAGTVAASANQTSAFQFKGDYASTGTFHAIVTVNTSNPNVGSSDIAVTFTITVPPCDEPTNLIATIQDFNKAVLNWTAPADATNLTEYKVYKSGTNVELASVPAGTTTATISNLTPAQHCFVVKAIFASTSCTSIPSNEACVTAQVPQGTVSGTVKNSDNLPIENATVTIGTSTGNTDATGAYTITLATGDYSARAGAVGYQTVTNPVTVALGTTTLNFTLNFTPCASVPRNLTATLNNGAIDLTWSMNSKVTLEAHNVWGAGDNSGYQMLIDADANAFGTTIPATGPLSASGDVPASVYDQFEYKLPENADGALTTTNMVFDGEQSVDIAPGTYDYCITNPTPNDKMWIAGSMNGRKDDYVIEAGKHYRFTAVRNGNSDSIAITITALRAGEKFKVFRNGTMIADNLTTANYTDSDVIMGTLYCYKVQTICANGQISAESNEVCITPSNIALAVNNEVALYPNPAKDMFTVSATDIILNIEITNVLGQVLQVIPVKSNNVSIDLSNYANGMYLVTINTATTKHVQRLSVTK